MITKEQFEKAKQLVELDAQICHEAKELYESVYGSAKLFACLPTERYPWISGIVRDYKVQQFDAAEENATGRK